MAKIQRTSEGSVKKDMWRAAKREDNKVFSMGWAGEESIEETEDARQPDAIPHTYWHIASCLWRPFNMPPATN